MRFMLIPTILIPTILVSCGTSALSDRSKPMLPFHGAGNTELGVVSVKKGVDRGSIEWHLVADRVGEDLLTDELERRFGMKRLKSDADLEMILKTKFGGVTGHESAKKLWARYRSATFSGLECGNATIIFFDSDGLTVEAWPLLKDVTGAEQAAS